MTYQKLEKIIKNRMTIIFGYGKLGKTIALTTLRCIVPDSNLRFCDNNVLSDDGYQGIALISPCKLYPRLKECCIFIAIKDLEAQKSIKLQLANHGAEEVYVFDYHTFSEICESIESSGNPSIMSKYDSIMDDRRYLNMLYNYTFGHNIDLENPKTFNEKLQWLKVYDRNPNHSKLVDKYDVKKYVSEVIGHEHVIPTIGVWDNIEEVDFDTLPDQFVLKCTHDSGSVIIRTNRDNYDICTAKTKLVQALRTNYYWNAREWPYKNVRPKIIAEPLLEDGNLVDYKFLCFGGQVRVIFICSERNSPSGLKVTFFDREWNRLPFERHYPSERKTIEKPEKLNEMIELAERLSKGICFVRVDLYYSSGHIYFGEMTFFPGGGMEEFTPEEWDYTFGSWIDLSTISPGEKERYE